METPIENKKFYRRKIWFPVGVFSLCLLPLLLYNNLLNRLENDRPYFVQKVELEDLNETYESVILKVADINLDNSRRISTNQLQTLRKSLFPTKDEVIELNYYPTKRYAEISLPTHFTYQDFVTLNDSLQLNNILVSLNIKSKKISISRAESYCGTGLASMNLEDSKRQKPIFKLKHYIVMSTCFLFLFLFNIKSLNKLRMNQPYFPA